MSTIPGYPACPANIYDLCLFEAAERFQAAIPSLECCIPPPWMDMPATGQRFQRRASIDLPVAEGVETQVFTWPVPPGWDGIIITITCLFTGAGFVEGSGDIVWRLQDNYRYFRDLGNITISLGDLRHPYELDGAGYRIYSNDICTFTATLGAGALGVLQPPGRIICAITGWIYPHSEYRRASRNPEQG